MRNTTVADYMTRSPHTVGADQPISFARRLMQQHRIRHLPVLRAGTLVGMVSDRDLALGESLHPAEARVEEVMTPDPYAIAPSTALEWVAVDMAERKYGSVIVVDHNRVVGVFTSIDALRALAERLASSRRRH
jgi:acetoin utilization protein AcuB